ncbi:acyl carrier protein [Hymenobacter swuensis]|uniref:Carrier domain-containing protein n=1 Tax=Hymenobacter swuensis DY53 TaxID=1227739 RepID=W8F108_9BACT|nr:hypothetical protein [Hymenobacter swuensis]AHJ99069.1 hypothetical protein Hsw_3474 [Hymenobacter swuensis DY53]
MGLDTVELIVAFEQHFQIAIPNRTAETIYTVADAAAAIVAIKGLSADPDRTAAYYQMVVRLLDCLPQAATETTRLIELELLGDSQAKADALAVCLNLRMPKLPQASWQDGIPAWWQRLFGSTAAAAVPPPPQPAPNWAHTTVSDLAEWLLAQNYAQLLPQPTTLYEVQCAVIGITCYQSGVTVPEIRLMDSFTGDLGMD